MEIIAGKVNSGKSTKITELAREYSDAGIEVVIYTEDTDMLSYKECVMASNTISLVKLVHDFKITSILSMLMVRHEEGGTVVFFDIDRIFTTKEIRLLMALEEYLVINIYLVAQLNADSDLVGIHTILAEEYLEKHKQRPI